MINRPQQIRQEAFTPSGAQSRCVSDLGVISGFTHVSKSGSNLRAKPELLAPAGGMEQLRYAILFGADAVYLAADRFGLRHRADNFSLEKIPFAVNLAHKAGLKVFAACNTYMNDADIKLLPEYLTSMDDAGVDALIVSDLGAFRMARRYAPHTALHVSTQASTSNKEAALAWYELGASRVVCAREMSLESIAEMRALLPADLELEVFVHGAMCMAVSGRCLISDHMTGRSANKGKCTQPCRWNYALVESSRPGQHFPLEEDGRRSYLLSSKDLCMLEHLDDLVEAGIDSIKIEGRNKKAFYVATVVNAYRQVLDGVEPSLMLPELETISHRPYSSGFFYGSAEQAPDQESYLQTYDWVAEGAPIEEPVILTNASESELLMVGEGVPSSSSDDSGSRRTKVICRNRFYEGDILEVLSPHRKVSSFVVCDLRREYGTDEYESVLVANQAMELYSFTTDLEIRAHDILRVKRGDPARKN